MTLETERTLSHFIYGKTNATSDDETQTPTFDILAMSDDLTPDDAHRWREVVNLHPQSVPSAESSVAVGIFNTLDDTYVLARVLYQDNDPDCPLYHYVGVSQELLSQMAGNINTLIETTALDLTDPQLIQAPFAPLSIPQLPTWAADKRLVLLNKLLTQFNGEIRVLLVLLDRLIAQDNLQIQGYTPDIYARLNLVEGLLMLLPPPMRSHITFATNILAEGNNFPKIIFSDADIPSRQAVDLTDNQLPDDVRKIKTPYVQHLGSLWQGELQAFINNLRAIDSIAHKVPSDTLDWAQLDHIIERHVLDTMILAEESAPVEQLMAVLRDDPPQSHQLLKMYTTQLLRYALLERDPDAVTLVTHYMDEHSEIDNALNDILTTTLESEPDSVYNFVRTRITQGLDDRWLQRLKDSAVASLRVAISDGDSDTLIDWLRLIAREPDNYQLKSLVHDGIEKAQVRTHHDGALGAKLLLFASRRSFAQVDRLLDDPALLEALDAPLGTALRDTDPEAVATVVASGREIAMVVLARVAENATLDTNASQVFTPAVINHLWSLHDEHKTQLYPPRYQPTTIISRLVTDGTRWLHPDATQTLLTHIIADAGEVYYKQITAHLASQGTLFPMLPTALNQSGIPPTDIVPLVNQLVDTETIDEQEALNTYAQIVSQNEWASTVLPLVEQIARLLQQNSNLTLSQAPLWRMLTFASELEIESITRLTCRRLVRHINAMEDAGAIIQNLQQVNQQIEWSQSARDAVMNLWREFVHQQPLARLQQFDQALHGKHDDEMPLFQSVVQTTVSLRKMIGTKSLDEFAHDLGTAFNVLQALSDSFDPINRHTIAFDQLTVRGELDAQGNTLTANERNLLAKNFKELAQLIITMSDHRSKSSLIRREGNIERQLLSGEQNPQSAIDTMKWLSGYLSGLQDKEDDDNG